MTYLVDLHGINLKQTLNNISIVIDDVTWTEGITEHLIPGETALVKKHCELGFWW